MESLAASDRFQWLHGVDLQLVRPLGEDVSVQRGQLTQLADALLEEAARLTHAEHPDFLPEGYDERLVALDTETTGLDTRTLYLPDGTLERRSAVVGICLAVTTTAGYYIPVMHSGEDGVLNFSREAWVPMLDRIHERAAVIYHNAVYDREVLALEGVTLRPFPAFFDTQLLSFQSDVNSKQHGLKHLSEKYLARPMLGIHEMFTGLDSPEDKDAPIAFESLSASHAYVYAASDAINTFALFDLIVTLAEIHPFRQRLPCSIDHRLVDSVRSLLRPGLPVDYRYAHLAALDCEARLERCGSRIMELAGKEFDMKSPKQLSAVLFDHLELPPPPGEVRGKMGYFSTAEKVLDKMFALYPDFPVLKHIELHRSLVNMTTKIFVKIVANSYADALLPYLRIRLEYSWKNVPTGRLSSSSSGGKETVHFKTRTKRVYKRGTGDAGLNSQGITVIPPTRERVRRISRLGAYDRKVHSGLGIYPERVREAFMDRLSSTYKK